MSQLNKVQLKKRIDNALKQQDLPTAHSSNIGKCKRNEEVSQEDQDEIDQETISVLERYETGHFTKSVNGKDMVYSETQSISQTQDSEIDPSVYREIIVNNCSEDLILAQSKILSFDHSTCLPPEDIQLVETHRKNARKIRIFSHILNQLEVTEACRYYHIETESYKVTDGNPRSIIEKSSQVTMPIIDELMTACKEQITPNMVKFASLDLTSILPILYTRDDKYNNCITCPLKNLLHKNDRTKLIECADIHLPRNLITPSKGRRRVYEVYSVFNNSAKKSPTKLIVKSFFKSIFQNFDEHIEWMMKNKDIRILLLVNRENALNDGYLSNNSIIGGVLFAVHGIIGTSINAIGIHHDYRYNSFGPFLIHLTQLFGAYQIELRSNGKTERVFRTYLACRPYLKEFYHTIGFEENENIEEFKKGQKLESIGKHIELDMWIEYEGDDKQIIMEIPTLCYKMRNYITPTNFHVEDCLYNNDLFTPKSARIIPPDSWKECARQTIVEFQRTIEKQKLDLDFLGCVQEDKFRPSTFYGDNIDKLSLPFIGVMFGRCISLFEQKGKQNRYHVMRAAVPSMKHLKLNIIQKHIQQDDNDEVWCHLTCVRCGKFCLVKNTSLDPIVTFIMKCIFSIWYQHVYTILPNESNLWNKSFPDWHTCAKRYGPDLEKLKLAIYNDSDIFDKSKDFKPYFGFYKYLESFLEVYINKQAKIRQSASVYICKMWCNYIKTQPEQKTAQLESTDEEIEEEVIEQSKKLGKSHKRNKRKKPRVEETKDEEENQQETQEDSVEENSHWTDSDSDISSVISVNDFRTECDINKTITEVKLNKIKNPQMLLKVQTYIRLKNELEDNNESETPKRRKYKGQTRKNKSRLKSLQKDIITYLENKHWYHQAKKDVKVQRKIHSIEYVDVSSKEELSTASKKYLEALAKMSNDEKIKMMELDEGQENLECKNHFVMFYGEDNKSLIVHPNWFVVEKEDVSLHRINQHTIDQCKKNPNVVRKLRKNELRTIKKSLDLDVDYHAIDRIERIKSTGEDTLVAYMEGSAQESIIKYKGYDRKSRTQYLTDAWLELNFKHLTSFWKQIKELKVGSTIKVPIGSSNNQKKWKFIEEKDKGPKIQFMQVNNQECLYYSLASGFYYMGHVGLAQLVISVYEMKNISNGETDIKNLVQILSNRKNQKFSAYKISFVIRRVKRPNAYKILNESNPNIVFHCVLENQHSICIIGNWIFDPIFTNAIKKTEDKLRFCAEHSEHESTNKAFRVVYTYDFNVSKKC